MILDEKVLQFPPPPYLVRDSSLPSSSSAPFSGQSITALPPHLLLHIISHTFPDRPGKFKGEGTSELHRQTLHWLHTSLRLVNRVLYIACMHVLRSTYLGAYTDCIRFPYTSDPFPSHVATSSHGSSTREGKSQIFPEHREMVVLDRFIALLAHEDFLQDASALYLIRDEAFKDLFDFIQPTKRLEDLVAEFGAKRGVVKSAHSTSTYGPTPRFSARDRPTPIPSSPSEKMLTESSPLSFLASLDDDSRYTYEIPPTASQASFFSASSSTTIRPRSVAPREVAAPPRRMSFFASIFKAKSKFKQRPSLAPSPSSSSIASLSVTIVPPRPPPTIKPLPYSTLSISFSPRVVKLMYTPPPPPSSPRTTSPYSSSAALQYGTTSKTQAPRIKRTLVEVSRTRDESLESTAAQLVKHLRMYLEDNLK